MQWRKIGRWLANQYHQASGAIGAKRGAARPPLRARMRFADERVRGLMARAARYMQTMMRQQQAGLSPCAANCAF